MSDPLGQSQRNIMKNISTFINPFTRKSRPVVQQMEFPLLGSRLTRAEADFLVELRRLREQLSKA